MAEIQEEAPQTGIKRTELRRDIDKEADKMRAKVTLPKAPGDEITDKEWDPWAKLLTEPMWNLITGYVYRINPKIIRQLSSTSNKNYIDKLSKTVDIREDVKRLHGGGKFQVQIVSSTGTRKICNVTIDIPFSEAEPILNLEELDLNAPENVGYVGYLKNKGILDDKGKPMQHNQPANGGSADLMAMFEKMMGLYQKMNADQQIAMREKLQNDKEAGLGGQIGNLLLERMKQDNPSAMLSVVTTMMDKMGNKGSDLAAIVPLFVAMMSKSSEQAEVMMKMQAENHKATLELLKDVKTPRGSGGEDNTLSGLKNAMEVFSMMDEMRGGGGPKSTWETVKDIAVEVGVPVLNAITNIYAIAKGTPGPGQQPPAGNAGTAQPPKPTATTGRTITSGDLARQAAREAAGQKPAVPEPEQTVNGVAQPQVVEPEVDQQTQQIRNLLAQAGGMIVEFMKQDRDGVDLAQHIVGLYTKVAHAQIATIGEERLVSEIKNFSPLWDQLSIFGEAKVAKFVHEFVDYESLLLSDPQYMDDGVDDLDDEPIDITTMPKRGRNKK